MACFASRMLRPTQADFDRQVEKELRDFFDSYVSDGSDKKAYEKYTGRVPLGLQYYTPEGKIPRTLLRGKMHDLIARGVTALALTPSGAACHVGRNSAAIIAYLCKTADGLGVDPINPCKDKMAVVEPTDVEVWLGLLAFLSPLAGHRLIQAMAGKPGLKPTPEFLSVLVNVVLGNLIYADRSIGMNLKFAHDTFVGRVRVPQMAEMMEFSRLCRVGISFTGALWFLNAAIENAKKVEGVIFKL